MASQFDINSVSVLRGELDAHPVYRSVETLGDLRIFMSHHVYSVWDFMSVIKYLQQKIAPSSYPWIPRGKPEVRHFINQLVLEEESDQGMIDVEGAPTYTSHFELYCSAMREIGADPAPVVEFSNLAVTGGIAAALRLGTIPAPSRRFVSGTFSCLESDKPHVVAAALALGREHVIPGMFRAFLRHIGIEDKHAPAFHYYLNRHIHLDEDFHAPISLQLLDDLCGGDAEKVHEAEEAARDALASRIAFWDGVLAAITARKG